MRKFEHGNAGHPPQLDSYDGTKRFRLSHSLIAEEVSREDGFWIDVTMPRHSRDMTHLSISTSLPPQVRSFSLSAYL